MDNKETKEKNCIFYASDYHFEMISLPYISKKIEEDKKVIILTDKDLDKTVKTLVSRINLNKEKKNKLLEINWKNEDNKKLNELEKDVLKENEIEVFVKGKEKYIKNINAEIENIAKNYSNIKIIDCYNIDEVSDNMENIVKNYDKVISTMRK